VKRPRKDAFPNALLLVLLAGCGGTATTAGNAEAVHRDHLRTIEELTEVLATVTDAESAEAARPRLKELAGRARDNFRRGQAAQERMTPAQKAAFGEAHHEELLRAHEKSVQEWARVVTVPGGARLHEEWVKAVGVEEWFE
jgi:hypothetical protein